MHWSTRPWPRDPRFQGPRTKQSYCHGAVQRNLYTTTGNCITLRYKLFIVA